MVVYQEIFLLLSGHFYLNLYTKIPSPNLTNKLLYTID